MHDAPTAADPAPAATPLVDWGVIRVAGSEARQFLHGQLTQDFEHLDAGQARLAGYCSPKGRLLATFVGWGRGADEVLLACSADLLPATLKRLSMFVLRARCKLSDASAEVPLWGLAGNATAQTPGDTFPTAVWGQGRADGADVIRLPDSVVDGRRVPRWLWAGPPAPSLPPLDTAAWGWLEVHSGVARVVGATVEQFVPQMLNFELVGGVNFQKGCYPGQEVVARSQYRGTIKRRSMVLLGAAPMQPGQEVFDAADPGQPAGRVALAGSLDGRHAALVELKLASLDGGSLHLGSAQGPLLHPGALPYRLPVDAPA